MKVFLTGVSGQLGHDTVAELERRGIAYCGVSSAQLDITDREAVFTALRQYRPDAVIHCAAFTNVDQAEDNEEYCTAVNAYGTRTLAEACRELDAKLLYVSTDYVFSGEKNGPYEVDDPAGPLNVYGRTKFLGEQYVQELLSRYYIVRTSWLIGTRGKNFVKTILRLSEDHDTLRVVHDQFGSPTFTADLAPLLVDMITSDHFGVYHATNEGGCTWADLAEEICRIKERNTRIMPVTSAEYGAKAVRPGNSLLSKHSLDAAGFRRLPDWKTSLKHYLTTLNESAS